MFPLLYNPPPTFVYMVWITPKLDQMVRFPGNLFDTRKCHMLPSGFWGQKNTPAKAGVIINWAAS